MLHAFSLANSRLPFGATAIARPIPPNVDEFYLYLACRLRVIHRAAMLSNSADKNAKKTRTRYKNEYYKYVRFELRFEAGDYVLFERPPLLELFVDQIAYKLYSMLLSRDTESYRVIIIRLNYAKIDHDGIQNTVLINRLARVAKEK